MYDDYDPLQDLLEEECARQEANIVRFDLPGWRKIGNPDSLGYAIRNADVPRVTLLLKEGADPNKCDYKTPLHWCIKVGDSAIATLLIDAGANTSANTGGGKGGNFRNSPLYSAIDLGRVEIVTLLVKNGADFFLNEALITAIRKPNLEIVKELVQLGADVNTPNSRSEFPIICAVHMKNFAIVKYLVEQRVDVDTKNDYNKTALSISLTNNDFRTVKLLIESGADTKLASEQIKEHIATNSMFADYMSKVQKAKLKTSHGISFFGQEAASE